MVIGVLTQAECIVDNILFEFLSTPNANTVKKWKNMSKIRQTGYGYNLTLGCYFMKYLSKRLIHEGIFNPNWPLAFKPISLRQFSLPLEKLS